MIPRAGVSSIVESLLRAGVPLGTEARRAAAEPPVVLDGSEIASWYYAPAVVVPRPGASGLPIFGPSPILVRFAPPVSIEDEDGSRIVLPPRMRSVQLGALMLPDAGCVWFVVGGVSADPSTRYLVVKPEVVVVRLALDDDGAVAADADWDVTLLADDLDPDEAEILTGVAQDFASIALFTVTAHARQPADKTTGVEARVRLSDPSLLSMSGRDLRRVVTDDALVTAAVAAQASAAEWASSPMPGRWVASGQDPADVVGAARDGALRGATWAVTAEATALAARAAETVPASTAIDPTSVPSPIGFAFLATAVDSPMRTDRASVRAVSWRTATGWLEATAWTTPADIDPGARWPDPDRDGEPQGMRPTDFCRWPLDTSTPDGGAAQAGDWADVWEIRLLVSLWALTEGAVFEEVPSRVDRATRRRVARRHPEMGAVLEAGLRTVRLPRRVRGEREVVGGSGRHLGVRVLVGAATGGFWRSQPYGPRRAFRRRVWVAPFWRGPEDGPVKDPDRVVFRVQPPTT